MILKEEIQLGSEPSVGFKSDHIRLLGRKTLKLETQNSDIYIKSGRKITLDSSNVKIGSKDASEALVLGTTFAKKLDAFTSAVAKILVSGLLVDAGRSTVLGWAFQEFS